MRINIKHQTSNVLNIVFWCIFLAKPPVPQSPTKVNARHLQAALWVSTLPGLYKEAVFAWLSPVWPDASITGSQAEAAAWRVDCRSSFILLNEKLVTIRFSGNKGVYTTQFENRFVVIPLIFLFSFEVWKAWNPIIYDVVSDSVHKARPLC